MDSDKEQKLISEPDPTKFDEDQTLFCWLTWWMLSVPDWRLGGRFHL